MSVGPAPERAAGASTHPASASPSGATTTPTSNDALPRAYRLGRLPFTLSGAGECARYLHSELVSICDVASRDVASRDVAPRDAASRDVAPRDVASRDVASRDVAPRDVASRDVASRDVASGDVAIPAGAGASDAPARALSPRLAFDFVSDLPPLVDYTATRPLYATEDSFRVSFNGLDYHVSRLEVDAPSSLASRYDPAPATSSSAPSSIALNPEPCLLNPLANPLAFRVALQPEDNGRRYRWFSKLYRARDWNFLSGEETHAKNFMYSVFDYLTHIVQLQLGQSYIHASGLERDGEGTAIVAWGGIGKTSAALKLITEHGFNFLSDDLGLVDDAGTIWRTPKRLQIYAYNLEGEGRLRSMLLDGRSMLDRASWAWKLQRRGPKGVRRRVSAEELFGTQSVARSAPLERIFCLERGDAPDFEAREITTEELTRRAAEVVMHEIEPFGLLSRALHSGHHSPLLPTQDQVVEATRAVLRRAFDGIPVVSIRIPLATPPATLANYLLALIEK